MSTGRCSTDQGIVISGGRVQSVAPFAQLRASAPSAAVIDLHDLSVLPGLIDCHAHLLGNLKDFSIVGTLRMSSAQGVLWGARNLREWLDHGFTTVRDAGEIDAAYGQFALREAVARGFIEGPRIFAARSLVSLTGGHGDANVLAPDQRPRTAEPRRHAAGGRVRRAARSEIRCRLDQVFTDVVWVMKEGSVVRDHLAPARAVRHPAESPPAN
ncbi:MAG TPA: amidohydrolase family protein [Myxococcales bacterium]|nr:amidohydrolase family protein [Myxococcales bacterium]